jgi:hypothetical protein
MLGAKWLEVEVEVASDSLFFFSSVLLRVIKKIKFNPSSYNHQESNESKERELLNCFETPLPPCLSAWITRICFSRLGDFTSVR